MDTSDSRDVAERSSPFQGLGFYTESDARWFFGRTAERKIILAHLRTARLTVLYAESGVGKSSLLRAGVAARLRELARRSIDGGRSPRFVPVVFSAWKDDPVADLISEIERQVRMLSAAAEEDGGGVARTPTTVRAGLATAIDAAATALDATLVIILDQFEEHFNYRLGDSRPHRVADELADCINSPEVRANFLIAVREDAYGGLGDLFSQRISNVYSNYLHLEYLSRDPARDAIEKPVELYNAERDVDQAITLDHDLADAVLDEVRRGNLDLGARRPDREDRGGWSGSNSDQIEAPFLQLVMTRLWECERAQGSRVLRKATLDGELGGAETIVRNHVSRALAGLARSELETATDIFGDLVTPSGVKVAHTAGDLAGMTAHPPERVVSVLSRLYDERILRAVDPAPGTTEARYEIFHDRLATPILDWRDQQENVRIERAKQRAEREAETQRAQTRRFRRRARITLGLALTLLMLLIALVVLLQYARDQSAMASREKRAALRDAAAATYFGLTTRAESQLSSRPDVALLLYLAAYSESPRPVAERSLVATLQALKRPGAVGILHGHTDAVEGVAFSPVGDTLASASGDKTIRLWTVTSRGHYPLRRPLRAKGPLYSAAFDATGQILASGGFNDIVLWNIARHAEEREIPYDAGAVTTVAVSRRRNMLAAGGSDGTVLLWNLVTHRRQLLRVSAGRPVKSVAFSPDGSVLATSDDRAVVLWGVASAHRLGEPLTGPTGPVYSVAFSTNGATIAAGGKSGTIVLWDLATHHQRQPTLSGLRLVRSVAFSPDGHTLAAGGPGRTMLWNLTSPGRGESLIAHHSGVNSVAFSPEGDILASAGADRTITLWNDSVGARLGAPLLRRSGKVHSVAFSPDGRLIASAAGRDGVIFLSDRRSGALRRRLPGEGGSVSEVAFDPAGRILAAASADGKIRLWDVVTGRPAGPALEGHIGPVYSIAFDHDGTKLVSGGLDGTVRLWDVRSRTELGRPLRGNHGAVYAVAFSPDGRKVASGGDGRTIQLWSAQTETPLDPPSIAQDSAVYSLAFSPDDRLLASGGADDTIRLWTIDAHGHLSARILTGDSDFIRSVTFSPDGGTLASGSSDSTVRLWDVGTGTQLGGALTGHTASAESVAFSGDGQFLASGSVDKTVRLWQAVTLPSSFSRLQDEVCSFLGAGLSRAEWSQYAPNISFHQSCPRTTPS